MSENKILTEIYNGLGRDSLYLVNDGIGVKPLNLSTEAKNLVKSYLLKLRSDRFGRRGVIKEGQIQIGKARALIKENLK